MRAQWFPVQYLGVLFLWVVFFLSFPADVHAIEYGGIGGRPGQPRPNEPRSDSIFIHQVQPGQVIEESVLVMNNSPERKLLLLYAADSTKSTDGGFACEQLSESPNDVGAWLSFGEEETEIELEPKVKKLIPFTITVPVDVSPGEYNGCVLIQDLKKSKEDGAQGGIHLSLRTGMRVLLTVPGDLIRQLKLLSFTSTPRSNRVIHFTPEIQNEGNVSIDAEIKITTRNTLGQKVTEHGGKYTVLRDDVARWNFEFPVPFYGGWFKTSLQVTYNDGTQDQVLEGETLSFFVWPQRNVMIGGAAALTVLVPLFVYFFIRMLVWRKRRRTWPRYIIKESDDVMKIAEQRHVSWKVLVKLNKLKPPYVLVPGEKLQVPPSGTRVRW